MSLIATDREVAAAASSTAGPAPATNATKRNRVHTVSQKVRIITHCKLAKRANKQSSPGHTESWERVSARACARVCVCMCMNGRPVGHNAHAHLVGRSRAQKGSFRHYCACA